MEINKKPTFIYTRFLSIYAAYTAVHSGSGVTTLESLIAQEQNMAAMETNLVRKLNISVGQYCLYFLFYQKNIRFDFVDE